MMVNSTINNTKAEKEQEGKTSHLPKLTYKQLLNLCVGIIGLQFAWSVQIALSSRVLESLGANPFLYGLIWCAGPITGIFVQPIVGALSDRIWTRFGRRKPFMMIGAILTCVSLILFPQSKYLAVAALFIWIIDASINISQGPYRALVPDLAPKEQHAIGNSFLSFAFGAGSVIAFGAAPLIQFLTGIEMSIQSQYLMAAIAIISMITYSSLMIKEYPPDQELQLHKKKKSILESFRQFINLSPEVFKLCAMQFFTWIGMMCIFLYFAPYVIHTIYHVPDLSNASPQLTNFYQYKVSQAGNDVGIAFALFNMSCLLCAIPLGALSNKLGVKNVYTLALFMLVGASFSTLFIHSIQEVYIMMSIAGIGWAGILSCPFAMLCHYIPDGEEGSVMGTFNMFIAGPQLISATLVSWLISQITVPLHNGLSTHYWSLAFIITGCSLLIAIFILGTIQVHGSQKDLTYEKGVRHES